jgi:hypothetical protein
MAIFSSLYIIGYVPTSTATTPTGPVHGQMAENVPHARK